MFYGGTNWATIGDPDVYTSYDYSACIREFGFFCGRGRRLRLAISFTRSFKELFRDTVTIKPTVKVLPALVFNKQRQSISALKTSFAFIRNFSEEVDYTLLCENITLNGRIPYKHTFISLLNYTSHSGIHLIATTIPIYYKTIIGKDEIWIVQSDEEISGQFAFRGDLSVKGSNYLKELRNGNSVINLQNPTSCISLSLANTGTLFIIALTGSELLTLTPVWSNKWYSEQELNSCFWGSTDIAYDFQTKRISVANSIEDSRLFTLTASCPTSFASLSGQSPFNLCPYIFTKQSGDEKNQEIFKIEVPNLDNWKSRVTDFDTFPWKYIPIEKGSSCQLKPAINLFDLGLNSGHVFYRIKFNMTGKNAHFDLNVRHRATIYLNNEAIGGHLTYSLHLFRAGSKFGPDAGSLGWKRYILPQHLLKSENTIVVQVENLGYNRQAFLFNDVKNPRGILDSRLVPGKSSKVKDIEFEISGIDTRTLSNSYLTSGFPDELSQEYFTITSDSALAHSTLEASQNKLTIPVTSVPIWYSCTFDNDNTEYDRPLRLNLEGKCTVYIWINETIIGKFYGNGDGPQKDFYIMDGLLEPKNNVLKIVCYDGRVSESGENVCTLVVSLKEWKLSNEKSKYWSGNKCEEGSAYCLKKLAFEL